MGPELDTYQHCWVSVRPCGCALTASSNKICSVVFMVRKLITFNHLPGEGKCQCQIAEEDQASIVLTAKFCRNLRGY
jgi:hypothetical protein